MKNSLPTPTSAERVRELEIKISFLEKHVEEQDRAMLGHFRQIDRLEREVKRLARAIATANAGHESDITGGSSDRLLDNERPPHY
jgi:uncharacterized coiled-coil protein SlyX